MYCNKIIVGEDINLMIKWNLIKYNQVVTIAIINTEINRLDSNVLTSYNLVNSSLSQYGNNLLNGQIT